MQMQKESSSYLESAHVPHLKVAIWAAGKQIDCNGRVNCTAQQTFGGGGTIATKTIIAAAQRQDLGGKS